MGAGDSIETEGGGKIGAGGLSEDLKIYSKARYGSQSGLSARPSLLFIAAISEGRKTAFNQTTVQHVKDNPSPPVDIKPSSKRVSPIMDLAVSYETWQSVGKMRQLDVGEPGARASEGEMPYLSVPAQIMRALGARPGGEGQQSTIEDEPERGSRLSQESTELNSARASELELELEGADDGCMFHLEIKMDVSGDEGSACSSPSLT